MVGHRVGWLLGGWSPSWILLGEPGWFTGCWGMVGYRVGWLGWWLVVRVPVGCCWVRRAGISVGGGGGGGGYSLLVGMFGLVVG